MFKQWYEALRILLVKNQLQSPRSIVVPRFKMSIFVFWLFGLLALGYGHVFTQGRAPSQSVSLFLSGAAALGALAIMLVSNSMERVLIFLKQLLSLIVVSLFFLVLSVTYSLFFLVEGIPIFIRTTWLGGAILLALTATYVIYKTFLVVKVRSEDGPYPGMRSAALLLWLFFINIIWWKLFP